VIGTRQASPVVSWGACLSTLRDVTKGLKKTRTEGNEKKNTCQGNLALKKRMSLKEGKKNLAMWPQRL